MLGPDESMIFHAAFSKPQPPIYIIIDTEGIHMQYDDDASVNIPPTHELVMSVSVEGHKPKEYGSFDITVQPKEIE